MQRCIHECDILTGMARQILWHVQGGAERRPGESGTPNPAETPKEHL